MSEIEKELLTARREALAAELSYDGDWTYDAHTGATKRAIDRIIELENQK